MGDQLPHLYIKKIECNPGKDIIFLFQDDIEQNGINWLKDAIAKKKYYPDHTKKLRVFMLSEAITFFRTTPIEEW